MRERRPLQELRLVLAVAAFAVAGAGCASRPEAPERGPQAPVAARGPVRAPSTWEVYVVQPGDTLAKIAACRAASVDQLARANGIRDPDLVMVGERLRVPAEDRCAGLEVGGRPTPAPGAPAPPTATAVGTEAPAAPTDSAAARRDSEARPDDPVARARAKLAAAQADYDAARFEEALAGAQGAAEDVADTAGRQELAELRARCYLLAGMAAAALDQRERALALFGAAFALDPDIPVTREQTSPRILELVDQAAPAKTAAPAPPAPR